MEESVSQKELELLARHIAVQYCLIDGKVEVLLMETGEYRFQGFCKVGMRHRARVLVVLDAEAACHWVNWLRWINQLPARRVD